MIDLVYFSSASENTHRFVNRLDPECYRNLFRLPIAHQQGDLIVDDRYVLIVPTYANNRGERAVPAAVIRFLNSEENRMHLVGVIGSGNKNFGNHFALAANVISAKTGHPVLYKYELLGTDFDVREVEQILRNQHATRPN